MKNVIENVFMVWLHSENAIFLLVSHTFSSIFSASKQILYKKIHFHPHTSIHRKSTITHTPEPTKIHHYPHKTYHHTTQKPPKHHHPHHHNNNKKIRDQRKRDWEIEGKRDRSLAAATIDLGWVENEIGAQLVLVGAWLAIREWEGWVLGGDDENEMREGWV